MRMQPIKKKWIVRLTIVAIIIGVYFLFLGSIHLISKLVMNRYEESCSLGVFNSSIKNSIHNREFIKKFDVIIKTDDNLKDRIKIYECWLEQDSQVKYKFIWFKTRKYFDKYYLCLTGEFNWPFDDFESYASNYDNYNLMVKINKLHFLELVNQVYYLEISKSQLNNLMNVNKLKLLIKRKSGSHP